MTILGRCAVALLLAAGAAALPAAHAAADPADDPFRQEYLPDDALWPEEFRPLPPPTTAGLFTGQPEAAPDTAPDGPPDPAPRLNDGHIKAVVGVVLFLILLIILRWILGRRLRWLRRLELHSLEQAMMAQGGFFLRRSRRWKKFRALESSIADTPLELWGEPLPPDGRAE